MIGFLEGELLWKSPGAALIKVGGVGYQVAISLQTFYALPEPQETTSLHIHTRMSEGGLELFGFSDPEEKELFQQLLAIPRIGARMALNILSGITPQELTQVLATNDLKRLASIPGVGRKSAERIILELRFRCGTKPAAASLAPQERLRQDALSALVNLGYAKSVAEQALNQAQAQGAQTLEELLRQSLRLLAK